MNEIKFVTFFDKLIVTVSEEPVLFLVGPVEEEIGLQPLGISDQVAGYEAHESVAALGALGDHPDLAADHVDLLVHVPVPRQPARAGPPSRPPPHPQLLQAVAGDPPLDADVVDFFERAVEFGGDSFGRWGFMGVLMGDWGWNWN